ncbi:MAG: hypothetical protein B7Y08_01470 [Rhodospirillales bacterium 24-66-33]|nr:MAG: hypothetical protein B7Y57_01110 [Rhodospirillales bacterium 35-66-84]OYZ96893.1 MAG: hypothetical protein B7Y08_01470 [Rhodospirillales bacterium 24-66-33]OZB27778.1 MAG: hypothetical protein B7X63_03665 [Rhodospirillales bacterium 39-66-50]
MTSKKAVSRNLQVRNSQLSSDTPEKSVKVKLQASKRPRVTITRFEIALVKVEAWKRPPRKLHSRARKSCMSQRSKVLTEKLHFSTSTSRRSQKAKVHPFFWSASKKLVA